MDRDKTKDQITTITIEGWDYVPDLRPEDIHRHEVALLIVRFLVVSLVIALGVTGAGILCALTM